MELVCLFMSFLYNLHMQKYLGGSFASFGVLGNK
jgi:hypothetical protein